MNTTKQKILDKVIKLLTLAEGTTFSEEADTAKKMAAELMARYDIQEYETCPAPEFVTDIHELTRLKLKKYESMLYNHVSAFNGIVFIRSDGWGSSKGKIKFVGKQSDLECNEYMLDIIKSQRKQMWKNHSNTLNLDKRTMKQERELWHKGFSIGIAHKLQELTEIKESKIQEWGLVVVDKRDQALAVFKKNNKCSTSKSRGCTYNQAGYDSGKSTSIHTGVNHAQGKTMQIA